MEGNLVELNVFGRKKKMELITMFEFSSERKCMSVIIRENNLIKLYVKGADNVIGKKLRSGNQPFLTAINDKVYQYAQQGLRTLCIAMRVINDNELQSILERIQCIIEQPNRQEKLDELAQQIEEGLFLLGCTGIEDQLQDRVPKVVKDMFDAGIKVWMLTGDKMETADNIARSCNLFQNGMEIVMVDSVDPAVLKNQVNMLTQEAGQKISVQGKGLLIDGSALGIIFSDNEIQEDFMQLAKKYASVVVCRATPKQKAWVVSFVRKKTKQITLAIGDGANDVNMIQEANIGIGIYGNEGMRAVQASDYAIGEFKFLWRLLFLHGRWNYLRIAEMILYFFYKNAILTLPQLVFAFYSSFTASTVFDPWYLMLYNTIFTAIPLICRAVFDQDFHFEFQKKQKTVEKVNNNLNQSKFKLKIKQFKDECLEKGMPKNYFIGQQETIYNFKNLVLNMLYGAIQGTILFFCNYFMLRHAVLGPSGVTFDLWGMSITYFTEIFIVVNVKLAIHTRHWQIFHWVTLSILSFGIYLIYFFISNYISSGDVQNTPLVLLTSFQFYGSIIVCCGGWFIVDLTYYVIKEERSKTKKYILRCYMKKVSQIINENDSIQLINQQLEQLQKKYKLKPNQLVCNKQCTKVIAAKEEFKISDIFTTIKEQISDFTVESSAKSEQSLRKGSENSVLNIPACNDCNNLIENLLVQKKEY
eukprot:TRINITY_DN1061_c0_g2_i1.p1 TRINITY_DN1061_c0_g2~~TRINITY_DN1061_c0_g2_i1.p1  ORF type:complete len:700 (+),score=100.13 TRINITY_DN1061_c0_g2_i1:454-2553(+)